MFQVLVAKGKRINKLKSVCKQDESSSDNFDSEENKMWF